MPAWTTLKRTVQFEIEQKQQEGCNVDGLLERLDTMTDESQIAAFYAQILKLTPVDFKYTENTDYLAQIEKAKGYASKIEYSDSVLKDKIAGGVFGRFIGCALGKPFETYPFVCGDGKNIGAYYIRKYLEGASAWPLNDYVPAQSEYTKENSEAACNPDVECVACLKENIKDSSIDDDTGYTVLGFHLVDKFGIGFTTYQLAKTWQEHLPYGKICTAEVEAFKNYAECFCREVPVTEEAFNEKLEYIRETNNPYREYLGTRIRVDGYSMCCPGKPYEAMRAAVADANFTHTKNGVYSAYYVAALIALAYTENDVEGLVRKAISLIPDNTRLKEAVEFGYRLAKEETDFYVITERIWERYKDYCWIHALTNDCLLTAALIYSGGNFEKGITCAVMGAYDTDCNGATAGTILGILNGNSNIPERWKKPLNNSYRTHVVGYSHGKISDLADWCYSLCKR